jgi:hypothetical protein
MMRRESVTLAEPGQLIKIIEWNTRVFFQRAVNQLLSEGWTLVDVQANRPATEDDTFFVGIFVRREFPGMKKELDAETTSSGGDPQEFQD